MFCKISFLCSVCFDEIDGEEKNYNALPCGHICCTQCWINYLKSLINDAKVENIKCIDHKCNEILPEEFIMKHIETDQKIVNKYNKFKARAEIINNPNNFKNKMNSSENGNFIISILSKYFEEKGIEIFVSTKKDREFRHIESALFFSLFTIYL